ncbi:MAG: Outer membrane protein assembly factor BamB [Verrucomicrobia subdivision 3 bacterium]|nr:Outer membrane protein assembly factor BamB [Limisphaerales bacterium]MCS1417785.1 Outer membrane protein assembly factor BamB [Limisphaerales bacterium]
MVRLGGNFRRWGGILFGLIASLSLGAEDWPNFRGPRHDGVSNETGRRLDWAAAAPEIVWRAEVGIGFSAFAVVAGKAFTIGHVTGEDVVSCLDEDSGRVIWTHRYSSELGAKFYIGGPGSTPTVDSQAGLVHVMGKWGEVLCLSIDDGAVKWRRQLARDADFLVPDWGFNGSPLLWGGLVILNMGSAGVALEGETGKIVWRSKGDECGYSTPVPYRAKNREMIAVSSGEAYSGVNARTGKVEWAVPWFTRYGVNAADPIIWRDEVFVSSGYQQGSGLFPLGGGELRAKWKQRRFRAQQNAPVRIGSYLYGFDGDSSSRAKLKCLSWETGEVQWEDETFGYGALSAVGDHLILISSKGRLGIAKASPSGFKVMGSLPVLEADCWTVPVLANGRILCRNSHGSVVSVDIRAAK